MRPKLIILPILVIAALARHAAGQPAGTDAVVIADLMANRLIRVADLSDTGVQLGPTISGLSLNAPWHLGLDSSGRIYIADRDNFRIVRMDDVAGNGWKALSGASLGILADGPGAALISSVTTDRAGRIYVNAGRVIRVDDMNGAGKITFGFPAAITTPFPETPGSFYNPKVLIFDQQGRFIVSDADYHRIDRFDDMNGTGWITFGSKGTGSGQFYRPEGMAVDSAGRIYIADNYGNRIVRMNDMTGAGFVSLGGPSPESNALQFSGPHDIKVDSLDRVWIADTGNHRIGRINDMTGAGWIAFAVDSGGSDLNGQRHVGLIAAKGIQVMGLGPALTYASVLPQLQVGGRIRASILGVNTGTVSANAEVTLTKSDGTPFPVTVDGVLASTFSRTIGPMATVRLDPASTASLSTGSATLRSREDLNGGALLQIMDGDTITTETTVRFSPPTGHFTIYFENVSNTRSGYALANFGTVPAIFQLTLRNNGGAILATATSSNLMPGQQFTEFADQRFPAVASPGFEGSIEFDSGYSPTVVAEGPGYRVGAVGFRYDNSAADVFTTIPVISNVSSDFLVLLQNQGGFPVLPGNNPTTLYYPLVADGGTYRTNFNLVNLTGTSATATFEFFGGDGTPLPLPIAGVQRTSNTVTLGARGTTRFATDGTGSGLKTGWARVTSLSAIGGGEIIQTVAAARVVSEAGVASSPLAPRFMASVDGVGFAKSELAVANPNNLSVPVTWNLRDSLGQVIASTAQTLPPLTHLKQSVAQIFPAVYTGFDGTLELVTTGASVSEAALRYDNPGGTVFAELPVIALRGGVATPLKITQATLIQGATVNAASFRSGAPVSGGGIVTAFGVNLASAGAGGVTVRVNGAPAFVFGAFPGQINFQVPWELSGQ